MVAVTAPVAGGALRRRLADARTRLLRVFASAARMAGAAARWLFAVLLAARAVAGLAMIAGGAWLWEPAAGLIVAGAGLIADRILDERHQA